VVMAEGFDGVKAVVAVPLPLLLARNINDVTIVFIFIR